MTISKFQKKSTTYRCCSCGKTTRDTGAGERSVDMCKACYQEAELENAHMDGMHAFDPNCPICKSHL